MTKIYINATFPICNWFLDLNMKLMWGWIGYCLQRLNVRLDKVGCRKEGIEPGDRLIAIEINDLERPTKAC